MTQHTKTTQSAHAVRRDERHLLFAESWSMLKGGSKRGQFKVQGSKQGFKAQGQFKARWQF
jgi:hypothetical protein